MTIFFALTTGLLIGWIIGLATGVHIYHRKNKNEQKDNE